MIDELKCRVTSVMDYLTGKEDKYHIFDDNKNMYRRGRKLKAIKKEGESFKEEDGWMLHLTTPDGTKFYWKKREGQ